MLRTRAAYPRNPNSWNSSNSRGPSQSRRRQPSQSNSIGTSRRSATSFLLVARVPSAIAFLNASFSFGPPSLSTFAIRLSRVPYSASHLAAVFGPHPGTPFTLSTLSPTSAWKSITWSGRTPQSAISPAASRVTPFRRLRMVTLSLSNCRQSLSDEHRTTLCPRSAASVATVAMMSSASYPGTRSIGIRMAASTWSMSGSWAIRSSGGGSRCPLYSGNRSSRNVLAAQSNVASRYSAPWSYRSMIARVTPNTAFTARPSGAVIGGRPWYIWNTIPWVSSR